MFSSTTFGPNLILDGLLVYYDITNPNCFNGTGDTVYNLVSTKYNATIVDSPIYNSTYPQTINFNGSSYAYYNIDLPESYTIIAIVKSNTYFAWDVYPFGTGNRTPLIASNINSNDGFSLYGLGTNQTYNTINGEVYSSTGVLSTVSRIFSPVAPYQIDTLNFYASSWSSNSQLLKVYDNILVGQGQGSGNNLFSASLSTSITRTSTTNANVELASEFNGVFRSYITMGAHLLYNRQFSDQEMQMTYQILKSKFNLIY